jgi:hypothetical protein
MTTVQLTLEEVCGNFRPRQRPGSIDPEDRQSQGASYLEK